MELPFSTSPQALAVYALAFCSAAFVGLLFTLAIRIIKSDSREDSYDRQLEDLLDVSDIYDPNKVETPRTIKEKWNVYWRRIGEGSGIERWKGAEGSAPKDAVIIWVALVLISGALSRNPFIGLAVGSVILYLITVFAKTRYNKQQAKIQDQIPGFLFALKANIQANETPSRAILKIVDNMPEPLRADLMLVKNKLLANASFAEALGVMVTKTTSNELRFLGTCLVQASGTGANIEPQIDTIQRVLEQRKKAADELARAVRATIPAIVISSVAIPGTWLAVYILDATSRAFWFKELLSWGALAIILSLWGFGLWMTRRMVEGIRNL